MSLSSRTLLLTYLARFNPAIYDALFPHGPVISVGSRHVMASMVIKAISREIKDGAVAKKLQSAGKSLFNSGTKSMSYDDDDWCGTPWPHHFGPQPEPWTWIFRGEEVMLNPQPLPPAEKFHYGALLTVLADVVSIRDTADTLRNIGASLMKDAPSKRVVASDVAVSSPMKN